MISAAGGGASAAQAPVPNASAAATIPVFTCFNTSITFTLFPLRMDQQLFLLINREWTSPALDLFMSAISDWAILIYPALFCGAAMLVFGGFKARAAVI